MLEQRLQQTFPDRTIEVVNTAMAAINSYTLLDFADEVLAEQPDAVLIYTGHNEYYGALGVGSSESLGMLRPLVRVYLRLQHLRTVQLLRAALATVAGWVSGTARGTAPESTLMERMVGEQSIPYGSPLYELGLRQFEENLDALLAKFRAKGVPVLVSTVASNERDQPPFISRLAPETDSTAWQAHFRRGTDALQRGDTTAALHALDAALRVDSLPAQGWYLRARLLEGQGRFAEARRSYQAARDRDLLRFRAPGAVNAIIRAAATREGVTLVDAEAAFAAAAPHGLIGHSLMLEHLHPTVDGYFLLADAFYEALRHEGLVGAWERPVPKAVARSELLFTAVDSLFGMLRVRQLMGSWPFQPPGVFDRSLDTLTAHDPVEDLALRLYRGQLTWRAATENLRNYYVHQGDYHRALRAALTLIQEYPFLPEPYAQAADILVKQRRYEEAIVYFEAANEREENAQVLYMIGSLHLALGRQVEGVARLERAVALNPRHPDALLRLGAAYALAGRTAQARDVLLRVQQLAPDNEQVRQLLARLPAG
jgi:tetratricopeptide (TPR) repeat protein